MTADLGTALADYQRARDALSAILTALTTAEGEAAAYRTAARAEARRQVHAARTPPYPYSWTAQERARLAGEYARIDQQCQAMTTGLREAADRADAELQRLMHQAQGMTD